MTPPSRTVVPIREVIRETPSTVTLRFPWNDRAPPGQFVMVWIPGDDELPMSLSYPTGPMGGVTVKAMGATSRAIQTLRRGDQIG
ncbi:dihydroorotate dehydrogenase electron transfer subunit, partial [mine drainage metagenome]